MAGDNDLVKRAPTRKSYSSSQQAGNAGERTAAASMPSHWIVRDVKPDFGLDLHVEVFDLVDADSGMAETRGEHFYVQVKTKRKLVPFNLKIRERMNVAKFALDPGAGNQYEIPVLRCAIETSELLTVEAMGASVPVLLFLVDASSETVYYVCLNDYIAKILRPSNPDFAKQGKVTIYVPAWNVIDADDPGFFHIHLLARRAKLYSAFALFEYQLHELGRTASEEAAIHYERSGIEHVGAEFAAMTRLMIEQNLRLDIFQGVGDAEWSPLKDIQNCFEHLLERLDHADELSEAGQAELFVANVERCFSSAVNLGRMHEELVREWHLPTLLAARLDDTPASRHRPVLIGPSTDSS